MTTTEFDDSKHYGIFTTSATLTSQTGKMVRQSELVLSALRAQGVFDNLVDGTTAPDHDKLWLDKNSDPAVLKEWDSVGSSWVEMTFDRLFGRAIVTDLTNVGGTANAITVDEPDNFISNRLYSIVPASTNEAGGTTIRVTGVGTYSVVYGDGGAIGAGEFPEGQRIPLLFRDGKFEIVFGTATLSASSAAGSASDAADSATAAAGSASDAADSATSAAADKTTTSGYKDDAESAKTAAQSAQTAAESARDQTLASFDNFDDRYLGAKTDDPTTDNDGDPLVGGTIYFNSGAGEMRVYTGSEWVSAYVSGSSFYTKAQSDDRFATSAQGTKADAALPKAGGTMSGGLSFGQTVQDDPRDLSKHIALWGPSYGFSISSVTLNIVTETTGNVDVLSGSLKLNGTEVALVDGSNVSGTWPINISGNAATASNALGVGQTWADVTATRSQVTAYQNTTGRPIMVAIETKGNGDNQHQVSADGSTWLNVGFAHGGGDFRSVCYVIPDQWYYRIGPATAGELVTWMELR